MIAFLQELQKKKILQEEEIKLWIKWNEMDEVSNIST